MTVYGLNGQASSETLSIPSVFRSPIRPDLINFVHSNIAKNKRQPYAVSSKAGHQHSAESWGTGRAVARVPRISGGGTHRSGQGAFANSCRGGRMFAPTKIWRRWHRKVNLNQRRYAIVSAIAASAIPSLVYARGHRVHEVPELPLVVEDAIESLVKTKQAVELLRAVHAYADIDRVIDSRALRAGKGKARNRRFRQRRGPLVIYNKDQGIVKAFRNIPGVELVPVTALNLLLLAPGGHMGRFVIWTKSAFASLQSIYGSFTEQAELKSGYLLPTPIMSNSDISRIINSEEVQSQLRPAGPRRTKPASQKKNPLCNKSAMLRLNPHYKRAKQIEKAIEEANHKRKKQKKTKATRASGAFIESIRGEN